MPRALKSQLFEMLVLTWQSVDKFCTLPHKNNELHPWVVGRQGP